MKACVTLELYTKCLYTLLTIMLFSHQVYAQDEKDTIETDRPDETEAASVVPIKTIQLESGFYFKKDRQQDQEFKMMQYPVILARIGLLSWLELRVQSALQQNRVLDESNNGNNKSKVKGIAPLTLGTKVAMWQENGLRPQAAFMVMVDLPVGSDKFRPENPEPSLRLMFKNTLTDKLDLNYNLVYAWEAGLPVKGYAASIGAALTDKLTMYGEVFGNKPTGEKAEHSTDTGLLFLLTPTLQLDLAVGTPFDSFGKNYFITTGVSLRLPD